MVPEERFLKAPVTGVRAEETDVHGTGIGDLAAKQEKRERNVS